MMNFLTMTLSVTVGMTLGVFVSMVLMLALMTNHKVMSWLLKYYMKAIEKSVNDFDDQELGA